jgi:hypothetical protein
VLLKPFGDINDASIRDFILALVGGDLDDHHVLSAFQQRKRGRDCLSCFSSILSCD